MDIKTPMPTPRRNFAIAIYKNKIYCISGESDYNPEGVSPIYTDVVEVYNPATDTWETKTPIPTPRHGACANVVDGKIYVIGGAEANPYPRYVTSGKNEVYDPENDSWTSGAEVPTSCEEFGAAVVDEILYVIGGYLIDVLDFVSPSAVNDQYTPVEYGTPQTTPSPEPTSTPTFTPGYEQAQVVPILVVAVAGVAVTGAGFLLYRKRGRGKTQ